MKIVLFSALIVFGCTVVFTQSDDGELIPKIEFKKSTCDLNSNSLQDIDSRFEANDLVLIVSHSGKNEKASMANRRLSNAKTFLTRMTTKARPPERVIATQGDRSNGAGYLDFFVKGYLHVRINFERNMDLLVQPCVSWQKGGTCSEEDGLLYYPCKRN